MDLRRWAAALLILAWPQAGRAQDAKPELQSYRLDAEVRMEIDGSGIPDDQKSVSATIGMNYRHARTPGMVVISIQGLELSEESGERKSSVRMTRSGIREDRDGTVVETKAAEFGVLQRRMLEAFDSPLVEIRVDEQGQELDRHILRHAVTLVSNGQYETAWAFHAPFPKDQDQWQAPVRLPLGQGSLAVGMLQFAKVKADSADPKAPVKVKVTGTLNPEQSSAGPRSATYAITGEQTYDPVRRTWVSGRWDATINFETTIKDQRVNGSGTMTITLNPVETQ